MRLVADELEKWQLRVTPLGTGIAGRGLETIIPRRDGDLVCHATSLFFDDEAALRCFLQLPGHHRYCDRVVKIEGVCCSEAPRPLWAVLVGVAQ